jgi:hypothetical protein
MKPWYESKLIHTGMIHIAIAAGDAVINGLTWRQVVMACVGAVVIYLRSITTTGVTK